MQNGSTYLVALSVLLLLAGCTQGLDVPLPPAGYLTTVPGVATTEPGPTDPLTLSNLSPADILKPREAIDISYALLARRGLEQDALRFDNANFAQVEFPNGEPGAFVAMGFSGIARGYQFLYRIQGNRVELVDLIPGDIDWGLHSLQSYEKTEIEVVNLLPDRALLKVTGAGHAGTGLWADGYFQIIDITNDGIRVLFSGIETEVSDRYRAFRYEYPDLDDDGNQEIVRSGEDCAYQYEEAGLSKDDCTQLTETFRFDGSEYVVIELASTLAPTSTPTQLTVVTSTPAVAAASTTTSCAIAWFFDSGSDRTCPRDVPLGSAAAIQRFEHGTMIWVEQIGRYFILSDASLQMGDARKRIDFAHDPLNIVRDTSAQITPPAGLYAPDSGFGLVWRGDVTESPGYVESLGWALAAESEYETQYQCDDAQPSGGQNWSFCYLRDPDGAVIVIHPLGGWYRLREK